MSEPSALIEAPMVNSLAAFDGRVLEVFLPYTEGSVRYHVSHIRRCWIDDTILMVQLDRNDRGMWPFSEPDRPRMQAMVAAIERLRPQNW
jgi:hypothetical protein